MMKTPKPKLINYLQAFLYFQSVTKLLLTCLVLLCQIKSSWINKYVLAGSAGILACQTRQRLNKV